MSLQIVEQVMLQGNLRALSPQQKIEYYAKVCESLGLNPLTKPFEYITLNGKEVLYATKACTEQLRLNRKVSIKIADRQTINGVYVVTAEAKDSDGREDSATGAVAIEGLKGDSLANAFMKAETKAKRRVTLSICGLGMLDESELDTIPKTATHQESQNPVIEIKNVPQQLDTQPQTKQTNTVNHEDFGSYDTSYKVPFGKKYMGMGLDDMGPKAVNSFSKFLVKSSLEKGKELDGQALEFYTKARAYLKYMNYEDEDDVEY